MFGKKKGIQNTQNPYIEKPEAIFITGLSGLRMIGVFGVILYHMFPYDVKGGFLGVTLFFIITGYLLAVKSEEARRVNRFSIGDFYLKRIKRLYPQLIIVVLVTCGVFGVILPKALAGIRPELASIFLGYNNFWQIFQNASYFERIANSSAFTHMWSLSNELQLYLIWPLIFLLFTSFAKKFNAKKAVILIGVLAFATSLLMPLLYNPGVDVTRIYYGTDTRIFSFLTGACIGFRRTRYRRLKKIKDTRPYLGMFTALLAIAIVSYIFMDGQGSFTYRGGMFLLNLVFAAMLVLATDRRLPIGRFLDNPLFAFFGKISYEMYLWMYPVIYTFHSLHLHRYIWAPFAMFGIIIVLSKWLNSFVVLIVKRKIDMKGNVMKKIIQAGFVGVCALSLFISGWGAASVFSAPEKDTSDIEIMQKELEEHANLVSQQNETASTMTLDELEKAEPKDSASTSEPKPEKTENSVEKKDEEALSADGESEDDSATDEAETGEEANDKIASSQSVIRGLVTAVGDSVMLGAAPSLQQAIPSCVVDAAESRQVYDAIDILKSLEAQGRLGDIVILGLGTNGPFSESTGQDIIDYLGADRKIYWVNVYGDSIQWVDESNDMIRLLCNKNSNVRLIDWNNEGPKHPEWFYNDGIHLKPDGQSGYAAFVTGIIG